MPDMLSTTDGYLDDTGLFDLQAVSTMGLQEEDLEAVLDTEGVQEAELSYSSDYLCDSEGEQYVVHLMAQSDMAKCQAEEVFGYGTCPGPWLSDRRQDHSL